jgi:hypothetical protein
VPVSVSVFVTQVSIRPLGSAPPWISQCVTCGRCAHLGRMVALVGDADEPVREAERRRDLGRGGQHRE